MLDPFEPSQAIPAEENAPGESIAEEPVAPDLTAVESLQLDESSEPTSEHDMAADAASIASEEPAGIMQPAEAVEAEEVAEAAEAVEETAEAPAVAEVVEEAADVAPAQSDDLAAGEVAPKLAWWPFLILVGLWIALAGAAAYVLTRASDVPAYQHEYYPAIVLAGVVLTLLGPVLAVITWAASPKEGERGGFFVTSIVRAAAVTLFGVLAWWGVLVAVDALRLGLIRL